MRAAALLVALAALAAGCGGTHDLARVGSVRVTQGDYDQALAHFRAEFRANGKPFPEEGTRGYATVRREIVGLLVYRAELADGAKRLGIAVSDRDAAARAASGAGADADAPNETGFAVASARASLLYERIYLRVTRGVPRAQRDAAMHAWLRANHARLARSTHVQLS